MYRILEVKKFKKITLIFLLIFYILHSQNYFLLDKRVALEKANLLLMPMDVAVSEDEKIYISDGKASNIKIYDFKTGKLIRVFGRRGQGPGEFMVPAYISISEKKLFVYDFGLFKQFIFDLKNLENIRSFSALPGDQAESLISRNGKIITSRVFVSPKNDLTTWTGAILNKRGRPIKFLLKSPFSRRDFENTLTYGFLDVDKKGKIYLVRVLSPQIYKFDSCGNLIGKVACKDKKFRSPVHFKKRMQAALRKRVLSQIKSEYEEWQKNFSWITGIIVIKGKIFLFIKEYDNKKKGWKVRYHLLTENSCVRTDSILRRPSRKEDRIFLKTDPAKDYIYILTFSEEKSEAAVERYKILKER